jgi:2-polyprenyl-3-methyl-5-hydroxy-6-metoxy-1,4-benzoquinol methylase
MTRTNAIPELYRRSLISWFTVILFLLTGSAVMWAEEQATPDKLAALRETYDAAVKDGRLDEAVKIAEEINWIVQEPHTAILLDIARLHARRDDKVKCFEALKRLKNAGYWDVRTILQEEAYAAYRQDPMFRELSRGIWANGYLLMLERDERRDFQKPEEVMKALNLKNGERVADIGAGSGYFTVPVARAVGPTGRVLALDIRQEMLDYLDFRLRAEGLENVDLKKVEPDDPLLPKGSVDTILMVDVLHYIKERTAYARKLREALSPGGRLIVIDYRPKPFEERPWGPPPEQQMSKESVDEDMAGAGFAPAEVFDFLPEQYFVVYRVAE